MFVNVRSFEPFKLKLEGALKWLLVQLEGRPDWNLCFHSEAASDNVGTALGPWGLHPWRVQMFALCPTNRKTRHRREESSTPTPLPPVAPICSESSAL